MVLWTLGLASLGLVLRLAGAQDDLWLDEVHSIMLSQSVHRADEVFWNINHDNNHFLNTLYLFLIGPDHSFPVLRLQAIVFGTLSIPAAGLAAYGRRRDTVAAVSAMLFTAVAYPSVHYGSEERGYAGMVFSTFLAIWLTERGLERRKDRILLGLVALLGALSYLFMVFPMMALGICRGIRIRQPKEDWFGAMARAAVPFWATIIAVLVPIAFIVIGSLHHSFQHGGETTHSGFGVTAGALCRFFNLLFGTPETLVPSGIVILAIGLAIAGSNASLSIRHRTRYCMVLLAVYGTYLMTLGAMASLDHPRYLMPVLAPVILLMADCASIGLRQGRPWRYITVLLVMAWTIATLGEVAHFYADGRGDYTGAVLAMTADGPATYTSRIPYGHAEMVDFYADRLHRRTIFIPPGDMCLIQPEWLLTSDPRPDDPPTIAFGPRGCRSTYGNPQIFSYWGLAGWKWVLYRRLPASP